MPSVGFNQTVCDGRHSVIFANVLMFATRSENQTCIVWLITLSKMGGIKTSQKVYPDTENTDTGNMNFISSITAMMSLTTLFAIQNVVKCIKMSTRTRQSQIESLPENFFNQTYFCNWIKNSFSMVACYWTYCRLHLCKT